jgi:hypothetical protein
LIETKIGDGRPYYKKHQLLRELELQGLHRHTSMGRRNGSERQHFELLRLETTNHVSRIKAPLRDAIRSWTKKGVANGISPLCPY